MKKFYEAFSFHIYEMNTQDVLTASVVGTFDETHGDTIVEWRNDQVGGEN